MINGESVIDKGMLLKQNRVISVQSSKFAVVMHFGLGEIVVNGKIITAIWTWEFERLSILDDRPDKRRLECVELTLLLVLTFQHCLYQAVVQNLSLPNVIVQFNDFSSAIKPNPIWNSRTTLSALPNAAPTRWQLRNYVHSPIKSVMSSVWQSCCFQCVRIVMRG